MSSRRTGERSRGGDTTAREPGGAGLAAEIADEQIALVYRKGMWLYLAGVANALVYIAFAWDWVPHAYAVAWALAIVAAAIGRWWIQRLYRHQYRGVADAPRWGRLTTLLSGLNGVVWAAASIWLYPPHALSAHLLLVLLAVGVSAGATAVTGSWLPAYYACVAPVVVALSVRLFSQGDRFHRLAAVMFILFAGGMATVARAGHRLSREGAVLRVRLARATRYLGELNTWLETRVHERTAELQEALAARDEFIQLASHELKTPLTALKLQHGAIADRVRRGGLRTRLSIGVRLRTELRLIDRMASLAQTLLDVSLIGAHKLVLTPTELELGALVRAVVATMNEPPRVDRTPIELRLDEPLWGRWDPGRVEHIVANLVDNALKYGAGRDVTVELHAVDGGAQLAVTDHGIGMAPEELARVFTKFARASSALHYGGLGLGLFLVKELVAAMDGRLQIDSKPDQGTRITVTLPSARAGAAAPYDRAVSGAFPSSN
jgi:signal transduction histidine kinase